MCDKQEVKPPSDEQEVKSPPIPPIDELSPLDVVSKVYDMAGAGEDPTVGPAWVADLPGVVDADTLRAHFGPGSYLIDLRARQGNTLNRQPGTIVYRRVPIDVRDGVDDGAEPAAPITPARPVPELRHEYARTPPEVRRPRPPTPGEPSAVHALVDLVRELAVSKQPQNGNVNPVLDALTIVERLQALAAVKPSEPVSGPQDQIVTQRLTTMFDEGLALGKTIGEATAAGDGSQGDGRGTDILGILERVLGHPTIKDALARASAPAIRLDEQQIGEEDGS